eukprot:jgi/Mesvir1/382/Mv11277-RA.1
MHAICCRMDGRDADADASLRRAVEISRDDAAVGRQISSLFDCPSLDEIYGRDQNAQSVPLLNAVIPDKLWTVRQMYSTHPDPMLRNYQPGYTAIVRLADRSLAAINPVSIDADTKAQVDALGQLSAVFSNNTWHNNHLASWQQLFPSAKVYGTPDLHCHPALQSVPFSPPCIGADETFLGEFVAVPTRGHQNGEVFLYHLPTKAIMATCTLWLSATRASTSGTSWYHRLYMWAWGLEQQAVTSESPLVDASQEPKNNIPDPVRQGRENVPERRQLRVMDYTSRRLMVTDASAYRDAVARVLEVAAGAEWMVMGHSPAVSRDGLVGGQSVGEAVRGAYAWLLDDVTPSS